MAKKKMCPYGSVSRGNGCSFIGRKHLLTKDEILKYCPKNTNSRCELFPSKKERVVKVKGYVYLYPSGALAEVSINKMWFAHDDGIECEISYKLPKGAK